jgi:hypothetical protein
MVACPRSEPSDLGSAEVAFQRKPAPRSTLAKSGSGGKSTFVEAVANEEVAPKTNPCGFGARSKIEGFVYAFRLILYVITTLPQALRRDSITNVSIIEANS